MLLNTLLPVNYDLLVSIWFLYGSKMKLVLSAVCQILYCEIFPTKKSSSRAALWEKWFIVHML